MKITNLCQLASDGIAIPAVSQKKSNFNNISFGHEHRDISNAIKILYVGGNIIRAFGAAFTLAVGLVYMDNDIKINKLLELAAVALGVAVTFFGGILIRNASSNIDKRLSEFITKGLR